jgi:cobalt-zinc-cadmium resistance protein CzcA
VVASAIPLSLLFAFVLMTPAGVAGSLMSLGAIDFGLIVDSSVIMVENVFAAGPGATPAAARGGARRRARGAPPTMFGELIILIVYLPILALRASRGSCSGPWRSP